jgi:endonuclease YncB( thermonuclease family)
MENYQTSPQRRMDRETDHPISRKVENIIFKSAGLGSGPSRWFSYLNVGASSFFVLLQSPNGWTGDFTDKVMGVLDGDTIEFLHHQRAERIRVNGIDCPEKGQPYGTRAKQASSGLVYGKDVTLRNHGLDKYGHTLGDVFLPDGTNVNHTLVKNGWCWWYQKYAPGDTVLEGLENEAREGRIGVSPDPQPVPPWEWRKRKER